MNFKDALRTLRFREEKSHSYNQLYTKWGEYIDPKNVLSEYPRPQLRRDNYTILNGYWNYSITKEEEWPSSFEGEILVPFSPESILSGVNRQLQPDELLWYERLIPIDKGYDGYRCILHFGAVDQYCQVFVNKQKVTEHMGGYLPFSIDITDVLIEGDNTLTVKVIDKSDTSYHSRGKQKLDRGGMFYTAQSGIWQTVWMEWVPNRYIEKLRITPMVDQNAIYLEIIENTRSSLSDNIAVMSINEHLKDFIDRIERTKDIINESIEGTVDEVNVSINNSEENITERESDNIERSNESIRASYNIDESIENIAEKSDTNTNPSVKDIATSANDGVNCGEVKIDGDTIYLREAVVADTVQRYICKQRKVVYVDDYDMDPDMKPKEEYRVYIYAGNKLIQSVSSKQPVMTISIPDVHYWTPEDPFLYDIIIIAGDDRVDSYFAMRKIEVRNDPEGIPRIYLNNELYFHNGILDQGYWPDGLYTAPSDEALIYDIKLAKDLGFNMIRKHLKIEPLRWYYHCDRLGMLVWQDMVNGGRDYNMLLVGYLPTLFPRLATRLKDKYYRLLGRKDEEGRKEWLKECKETVEHLYNCPSIVVWVPFNEGWGQFDAKHVYEMIQDVDKTRLIDHASGWFDQKVGDFKSKHNYFHPLKIKSGQRPVVLSEFGGYACYIPEHSYSWQIYGYRIYLTMDDLNKAYQKLMTGDINKLIQKGLSAAVYTQLSDVEDEVNGLVTYDRKICKVKPLVKRSD